MVSQSRLSGFALLFLFAFSSLLAGCDAPSGSSSSGAELPAKTSELQTPAQMFDLRLDALAVQADEPGMMQLTGELTTREAAELDVVKQVVQLSLEGDQLPARWQQDGDKRRHRFVFDAIPRAAESRRLQLRWDGKPLGTSDKGARELSLPALTSFEITGVRVVRQPETYVQVNFSAPLDRNQQLQGLVSLDQQSPRLLLDGASLRVYPEKIADEPVQLHLSDLIRSAAGKTLGQDYQESLVLGLVLPSVSFVGREAGILPPGARLTVPFEAAGVDSVQVVAFKIFENTLPQYLQRSRLHAGYTDESVGRYLWRKIYRLPELPTQGKLRYNLDLTELMQEHPTGLLRLELRIDRSNSLYACPEPRPSEPREPMPENFEGGGYFDRDQDPDWYESYYRNTGYYIYSERHNPCKDAYYYFGDNHTSARTFMVSDLGLVAKRGQDNQLLVVATRLRDARPLSRARIKVYNFQQQLIGEGTTDSHGMVSLETEGTPFLVVGQYQDSLAYLRVPRNEALPTNAFDVSGEHVREGLKGFIYGERDVWRPGDDIHLAFILEDREQRIPPGHPVRLDFFDPHGAKRASLTQVEPLGNVYTFQLKTAEDDFTGNWRAVVHLGNRYFDKVIKVESITPNRLKLDLTSASLPLKLGEQQLELSAQWLHGASAAGLAADVEMRFLPRPSHFEGYSQFLFDDPVRRLEAENQKIFDGHLNDQGRATIAVNLALAEPPAGMLTALFTSRVFEGSGDFSTALRSFEMRPFDYWVGLQLPKGDGYNEAISREADHPVYFQTLDAQGKPAAGRELEVEVYALEWRWWWDQSGENLASYIGAHEHRAVASAKLTSDKQGRAQWTLEKNTYEWGRHLVRVCDRHSGHCAGQLVYLGWSWNQPQSPESATQLMLSTDKERYAPGDVARVRLPKATQGRLLISIENGSRVLDRHWLELDGGTELSIPVTSAMAPNVYVHVSLLLPHQQRDSDAPMRLYGIVPLLVEDPQTRLKPRLQLPQQVRPETRFNIEVSEDQGRAMTYTLAVVDEGLLGLTGFSAPDPHSHFYRREALGVYTWDLFDQVVGAYGATLERVLAIGGSDAELEAERNRRERRFPPVVKFLGGFQLKAGETREHSVELPPYMGAVRVMLVASTGGARPAYGKAEASVTVTQPLVLLASLPRVLGPGEEVALPVNVFVSDPTLREVQVEVETNELVIPLEPSARLTFDQPGDAIAMLRLKLADAQGKARIRVTARSGEEQASQEIFIDSRAANPPSLVQQRHQLAPGETWTSSLEPHGLAGTNQASLEVSSLPPLNLEKRLEYLVAYPHGCVEQLTSAVFPQLYLGRLMELSEERQREIDQNINTAINRLRVLQTVQGSFAYWPGEFYVNDWATSYAGHLLLEARNAGYALPTGLLDKWIGYQQDQARRNLTTETYPLVAAYRLYTLALAQQPELPAMNRLREQLRTGDQQQARWLLSLAYRQLGLTDVADELLGAAAQVAVDRLAADSQQAYTFGSPLRDRALLLLTLVKSGAAHEQLTWDQAELVAAELAGDDWLSTQTTAWALMAMAEFSRARQADAPMVFDLREADEPWQKLGAASPLYRQSLNDTRISLTNQGQQPLHLLLSNRGLPPNQSETASAHGLKMEVEFYDLQGQPLSVEKLPQGTDFVAEVSISADFAQLPAQGVENLAASLVMPSGWQIRNERLEEAQSPKGIDNLDIRDDRVLAYFSLWRDNPWSWRYQDRHQTSVTLRIRLNASYAGRFYLSGWQVEAMYDGRIHARNRGFWVEVN